MADRIAAVAIGRNEGDRLKNCLASLQGQVDPLVYVDSGSTDGSVEAARALGASVVELDLSVPFTAARARNAGLARVADLDPDGVYVQFLDGDCLLDPDWITTAKAALEVDPKRAVVCGRRRERFPEASRWNRMIDQEWDTPIGEAIACGGDALMRRAALDEVGGYNPAVIAGEEPEMCFRMREKGWTIHRIDAEMTLHDAALTRMGQWWQRAKRAGHAYAECAALHGNSPEKFRVPQTRRAVLWGLALPLAILVLALLVSPWALLLGLIWPVQMLRLLSKGFDRDRAVFLTLGKFAEGQGVLTYWVNRLMGRQRRLIEYK